MQHLISFHRLQLYWNDGKSTVIEKFSSVLNIWIIDVALHNKDKLLMSTPLVLWAAFASYTLMLPLILLLFSGLLLLTGFVNVLGRGSEISPKSG